MHIDIKIPSVGESVQEAVLAQWYKKDGQTVRKDDPLFVIETDKVTLEVVAEADGVLKIITPAEQTVAIGAVVGGIDTAAGGGAVDTEPKGPKGPKGPKRPKEPGEPKAPKEPEEPEEPEEPKGREEVEAAEAAGGAATLSSVGPAAATAEAPGAVVRERILPPSVRRLAAEKNLDLSQIAGTGPGGRITKLDVLLHLEQAPAGVPEPSPTAIPPAAGPEGVTRKPMSPIRQRIAARLLEARQQTAMLTTFNEIDMHRVMDIRARYKDLFAAKHGVGLGFMSFFIKASVTALQEFAAINAFIEDDQIVYHHYVHVGVAIGSDRGLVVPVIRHAETLGLAQLEQAIVDYVTKIRENRLELADLEGGTFTISNGGVYGSLLSTPILNRPQSGILGMHKIEPRPVAVDDKVVIRPMMYVALSYDHRIVDGREAVTFLKRIKECIENPERMLMEI